MPDAPVISVLMPAYNVEKYVAAAVRSILEQTFSDFELIVIDDGSKDSTRAVVESLASQDSRVRLISRPNMGVSATANEMIDLARGEFLARMDSDDLSPPTRLEKQLAYMRANPDCVCLGARVMMMDQDALPLYEMPDVEFGHERIDGALMTGGWPIVQGVCMYRKSAVLAVGKFRTDLSLHEDFDQFLKLAEVGRLENLDEVLLYYRRHLSSITFTEAPGSKALVAKLIAEARQRRGLPAESPIKESAAPKPGLETSSLARSRHWAWMSLKNRHVATARKYAYAGLKQAPLSKESWKLMYCALRGR